MVDEAQAYIETMKVSMEKSLRNARRHEIARSVAGALIGEWNDYAPPDPKEIAERAVVIANALLAALATEEAREE